MNFFSLYYFYQEIFRELDQNSCKRMDSNEEIVFLFIVVLEIISSSPFIPAEMEGLEPMGKGILLGMGGKRYRWLLQFLYSVHYEDNFYNKIILKID